MSNGGDHRAEIEELRRQLSAKDALLAARTAELAAAKTGLIAKTLTPARWQLNAIRERRPKCPPCSRSPCWRSPARLSLLL
jgi:hypothetical protein